MSKDAKQKKVKPPKPPKAPKPPKEKRKKEKGTLPDTRSAALRTFFADVSAHCLLPRREKALMQADFERAFAHYERIGVPEEEAMRRLDVQNLGGFYARPARLWFPLDDAAKIYPLSMEHGWMSLFRLSVYLKKEVVPELLQMALTFSIKRFPSFATTLKKGFFWHYLDATKRRFGVEEERDAPCQPLKVGLSGSQPFRVLYYKNRISVEFFHVLTDGTGGMEFLKVLAAEYLRLTGVAYAPGEHLLDANGLPDAEEFENAFAKVPVHGSGTSFGGKSAVQMSGRLTFTRPSRVVHLVMRADELKAAARRYGVTVTGYLLGLMFLAGKAATDEAAGDTVIQLPVNMRKFYPSRTLRNFSMYCGIHARLEDIRDLPTLLPDVSRQLQERTTQEALQAMLNATRRLVGGVRLIPLVIKHPVAKTIYGFMGDKAFSNTLSNLGVIDLPQELLAHIDKMDFLLGGGATNRAGCSVVTVGNTTTFSISKRTGDPTFEEALYALLIRDGIAVTAEGSVVYEA